MERLLQEKSKHMPYPCWIYNYDIQQECVGINTCAADMLNALPIGKNEFLLNAHSSYYDCRFILEYLENVKQIVKGCRLLQIKATYYNPRKQEAIKLTIKYSYKIVPMALKKFGKCFKFAVSKKSYALQYLYI